MGDQGSEISTSSLHGLVDELKRNNDARERRSSQKQQQYEDVKKRVAGLNSPDPRSIQFQTPAQTPIRGVSSPKSVLTTGAYSPGSVNYDALYGARAPSPQPATAGSTYGLERPFAWARKSLDQKFNYRPGQADADAYSPPDQNYVYDKMDRELSPPARELRDSPEARGMGSPSPTRATVERGEQFQRWDAALWSLFESVEQQWETGNAPPACTDLILENQGVQHTERCVIDLLECHRSILRKLSSVQSGSRMQVIQDVARKSAAQNISNMHNEFNSAWKDWQEKEITAEREHTQVCEENEELMRRIAQLEIEEREVLDAIALYRAVRMCPESEVTLLSVEVNKTKTLLQQHENEFNSRNEEQQAKIESSHGQHERMTKELAELRQRNFEEETQLRQRYTRAIEVARQKCQELQDYKRKVLPIIQQYHAKKTNEMNFVNSRCAQLKELSDRHRKELFDLARPLT